MFGKLRRRYVRRMPKIYGNLQPRRLSFAGFFRFLRVILWLAAGVGAVYAIWYSGWFRIRKVEVEGTYFSSAEAVKAAVPIGKNIWFISKEQLISQILINPVIVGVTVFRGIPDSVRVVVEERKPALIWISGENSLVLDEYGVGFAVFTPETFPSPDSPLDKLLATTPRVTDTKSLPVTLGKSIVSPTFIQFLEGVQKELVTYLPEVSLDHLEIADTTYDLTLVAKQGLRVQFNTLGNPGTQVRNLTRLIRQNKAALNSQVDLRVDRWAYVK